MKGMPKMAWWWLFNPLWWILILVILYQVL